MPLNGIIQLISGRWQRLSIHIFLLAFHCYQQYNDIEIIYYISDSDGRTERFVQAFPIRYFFRYVVEHLLHICGFRVVEIFGDYDKSKYWHNSPDMILIAVKNYNCVFMRNTIWACLIGIRPDSSCGHKLDTISLEVRHTGKLGYI